MKAVVYENKALVLREVEKPIPRDGEVLVKISAVSINAGDYRSMKVGAIPKHRIFGADIAGRIEAVGKNVAQFTVGDEVFGDIADYGFGGFAEYAAAPACAFVKKPAGVSFEAASALPMAGVTALQALREGKVQPGQNVLIYGAGGGVGTFAVQLTKHFGAEVTAVCGEKNVELMRSIGADHVINYQEQDASKAGKQYDLVLAVNGNQPLSVYRRMLAPKGICVVVGGALSQVFKAMLFGPVLSLSGRKIHILAAKANTDDLAYVISLVENAVITPVIERKYPLNETADAVLYIAGGHARGKVVIQVEG